MRLDDARQRRVRQRRIGSGLDRVGDRSRGEHVGRIHGAVSVAPIRPSVRDAASGAVDNGRRIRRIPSYPCGHAASPRRRAQLNLVVGDLEGNAARILDAYDRAEAAGCDLVAFPELAITGYPPEDLLLRPAFVAQAVETLDKIAARTGRAAAVVGFPEPDRDLYNAAAVCAHGRVLGIYRKHLLPNYAVFDEERYFEPWTTDGPLFVDRRRAGRGLDLRGRVEPVRPDPHARPPAARSSS